MLLLPAVLLLSAAITGRSVVAAGGVEKKRSSTDSRVGEASVGNEYTFAKDRAVIGQAALLTNGSRLW